ncbi:MAG: ribbon-helix-helix protein, CopG family [Armatimonadetes bacterium]|nr:ribbon-helix-helix protein, CopG family [Armatimonadota bacterium]
MKRTQVQLDEHLYEALRRRAFEQGRSISALVRESLAQYLGTGKRRPRLSRDDFTFIGAGRSRQGRLSPVSERHDEALAAAFMRPRRR